MKRRNPRMGCRKIAEQISNAFGLEINKNVVRRNTHPALSTGTRRRWPFLALSLSGKAKDSLCSVDLFSCESILLQSYWVMAVMDVFTGRIVGFGVAAANLATRRMPDAQPRYHATENAETSFLASRSAVAF